VHEIDVHDIWGFVPVSSLFC